MSSDASAPKSCASCGGAMLDDDGEGEICAACTAEGATSAEGPTLIEPQAGEGGNRAGLLEPSLGMIGDFEIGQKLGQGGMGTVYRAWQRSLDRAVALKVLPAQFDEDPEFIGRFQREAKVAASLQHPNLVRVYAAGQAGGSHYIAMELVEGENLHQRLRQERLPMTEALRICADVARGLQCGWDHAQLVHRDVKPSNIYLSHTGEVKLGDLGLAKSTSSNTTGLTQSGTMMGTPHYMSPEQARGSKTIDFRADIYSLGCTLFELLTGHPPYPGSDPIVIVNQHLNTPPPALLKELPNCPIPVARLVGKMLKKALRERHASYAELIAELEWLQRQIESGEPMNTMSFAPAARRPDPATTKDPTEWTLWVAGALILLVVVVIFLPKREAARVVAAAPAAPAVPRATPAPPTASPAIDLLALVDLKRDAVKGTWSVKPDGLSLDSPEGVGVCELPYEPAEEYDLESEFTATAYGGNVNFQLRAGGASFVWKAAAYRHDPPLYGIDLVDGKSMPGRNEAVIAYPERLEPGTRHAVRLEVRRSGLQASVDGKEIFKWSGDYQRLSTEGFGQLRNPRALGIGGFARPVVFNRVQVREVSGHGTFTGKGAGTAGSATAPTAGAADSWHPLFVDERWKSPVPGQRELVDGVVHLRNFTVFRPFAADAAVRARIQFREGSKNVGLLARSTVEGGAYKAELNQGGVTLSYNPAGSAGRNPEVIGSHALAKPLQPGDTVLLELRLQGDHLAVRMDGVVVIEARDSRCPTGVWGVTTGDGWFESVEAQW